LYDPVQEEMACILRVICALGIDKDGDGSEPLAVDHGRRRRFSLIQ
jgi:hypothetical protein